MLREMLDAFAERSPRLFGLSVAAFMITECAAAIWLAGRWAR